MDAPRTRADRRRGVMRNQRYDVVGSRRVQASREVHELSGRDLVREGRRLT